MKYQQFTFPTSGNARARHVAYYLGVHISTVWRYAKRPDFPKPRRLTDGVTCIYSSRPAFHFLRPTLTENEKSSSAAASMQLPALAYIQINLASRHGT